MAEEKKTNLTVDTTPPETVAVEDYKMAEYQGKTLTVEQRKAKEEVEKKIADMSAMDGDRKKRKHEPANHKFKEQDVVQYMYEEWFLAGMAWCFNKIEDTVMNVLDYALDEAERNIKLRRAELAQIKDERLKAAKEKQLSFDEMALKTQSNFMFGAKDAKVSLEEMFDELRQNLNNPDPHWKNFDPKSPLILQLKKNPERAAEFLNAAPEELFNRIDGINVVGRIASMAAKIEMTDEMMRDDSAWRKNKKEYKSDEELKKELLARTTARYNGIMDALEDIRLDNRLKGGTLKDETEKVNAFLQDLAERTQQAQDLQNSNIAGDRFDAIGKSPNKGSFFKTTVTDMMSDFNAKISNHLRDLPKHAKEAQDLAQAAQPSPVINQGKKELANIDGQEKALSGRREGNNRAMARLRLLRMHIKGVEIPGRGNTGSERNTGGR